jgi:hypothetical protein
MSHQQPVPQQTGSVPCKGGLQEQGLAVGEVHQAVLQDSKPFTANYPRTAWAAQWALGHHLVLAPGAQAVPCQTLHGQHIVGGGLTDHLRLQTSAKSACWRVQFWFVANTW